MEERWAPVKALAEHQHGLFTSQQAAASGVPADALLRACHSGRLFRVRRGVYGFAGSPRSIWVPATAAGLAAGKSAALSHSTAAAVYALPGASLALPELTVPTGQRRSLTGVALHVSAPLEPSDRRDKRGVAVTSPARTLVDLATFVSAPALERALDEGAIRRLYTYDEVAASLRRVQGRAGTGLLRSLLAHRVGEPVPDSFLESRVLGVLAPYQPFEVHFQVTVGAKVFILDVAWPEWKVAAEIDGRTHRALSRREFDRERTKGNALAARGWRVAHLTSTMNDEQILLDVGRLLPYEMAGRTISQIVAGKHRRSPTQERNMLKMGQYSPGLPS